jgi:hypothetical protein
MSRPVVLYFIKMATLATIIKVMKPHVDDNTKFHRK